MRGLPGTDIASLLSMIVIRGLTSVDLDTSDPVLHGVGASPVRPSVPVVHQSAPYVRFLASAGGAFKDASIATLAIGLIGAFLLLDRLEPRESAGRWTGPLAGLGRLFGLVATRPIGEGPFSMACA
jgi:hypothetical protein